MSSNPIQFTNGSTYERYMGEWSRLAGNVFLDWLAPTAGLRWLDVGCGNGAFTDLLVQRCAPAAISGIDPSEAQLVHARTRQALQRVDFRAGDAMALPYPDSAFDAAVMPLVIFFLTDPARGVTEMARVVSPGGTVAAYAWDIEGGGFPYEMLHEEMRQLGCAVPMLPSPAAANIDSMQELWTSAGLKAIATHVITVERTFLDMDDFWTTIGGSPAAGPTLAAMSIEARTLLRERLTGRLLTGTSGQIRCRGRAHAVKGHVTYR